jgi:hypothetical protein
VEIRHAAGPFLPNGGLPVPYRDEQRRELLQAWTVEAIPQGQATSEALPAPDFQGTATTTDLGDQAETPMLEFALLETMLT